MPKKKDPSSQLPASLPNQQAATVVINLPQGYSPDIGDVLRALTDTNFKVALPINLPGALKRVEQICIDQALAQTHGSRQKAADLLGMNRTTLVEKLRRAGRAK